MATQKFIAPTLAPDVLAKQLALQSGQARAQRYLDQSSQPIEGQMVSGHYVAPSWTEYAARALNGYLGEKTLDELPNKYLELQGAQQNDSLSRFGFKPSAQQLAQGLGAQAYPVDMSGATQRPESQPMLIPGFNAEQSRNLLLTLGPEAYASTVARAAVANQPQTYAPQQSTSGFFQVGPDGVRILSDPNTGKPLMPVTADPGTAGAVAQARSFGTETGKTEAQNQANAPQELATTDQMLATVDAVMNHPGLDSAVGMIQGRLPPLTESSTDFTAKMSQLQGQLFLQAYQSLKGGGQITEVEGAKAEAAMAALTRAQSEEQFRSGLKDLRDVIMSARDRIAKRAGIEPSNASSQQPVDRAQQLDQILGF